MAKITKADLDKLIFDGQEYEIQEIKDLVAQLEIEKREPDGGDFVIFNGKRYGVKKATYNVLNQKRKESQKFSEFQNITHFKFWNYIPFAMKFLLWNDDRKYKNSWMNSCKATFTNNVKDFSLGDLTSAEMVRVMRIFFQSQAG
jgi:hypothetical protein